MDKGYHLLRLVGAVYKIIGLLCLLFATGTVCLTLWASAEALTVLSRYGLTGIPSLICVNVIAFLFFGGFPAIFFWSLSSLIDIQINVNYKVDILTAYIMAQNGGSQGKLKTDEVEGFLERVKAKL